MKFASALHFLYYSYFLFFRYLMKDFWQDKNADEFLFVQSFWKPLCAWLIT